MLMDVRGHSSAIKGKHSKSGVYTDRGSHISKQNMFCFLKKKKKLNGTKAKMKCVWQPSIFAA
jgi:hypothetical protein